MTRTVTDTALAMTAQLAAMKANRLGNDDGVTPAILADTLADMKTLSDMLEGANWAEVEAEMKRRHCHA